MTGISSHVFKRLVIVIFQSGSLTLAGWTTTRVSEYNRVQSGSLTLWHRVGEKGQ